MLTFATEFPITTEATVTELIQASLDWVAGSPHTFFKADDIAWDHQLDEAHFGDSTERLDVLRAVLPQFAIGGAKYTRLEAGLEWVTTVVGHKTEEVFWVGVRTSCDAISAGARIPSPKKPQIVKMLLERFNGGRDGDLDVSDKPNFLSSSHIDFAASLINNEAGNALPIVYVSSMGNKGYAAEPSQLASWLGGMAHVIVEPNRAFSSRLMQDVRGRNPFGGGIALYWPGGQGRKLYTVSAGLSANSLQRDIARDVRVGLAVRRPLPICTWPFLSEAVAKVRFEALKADQSTSVDAYIENFDNQLTALSLQLDAANKEVSRLLAVVRGLEAGQSSSAGRLLAQGSESSYYADEIVEVVIEALESARQSVVAGSRRQHILDAVLTANSRTSTGAELSEKLKDALRDYRSMDAKTEAVLEELGFEILEDGKHYKLIYQGDSRYIFAMSRTSSDHRAGLNMASDIRKKIF